MAYVALYAWLMLTALKRLLNGVSRDSPLYLMFQFGSSCLSFGKSLLFLADMFV